MDGVKALGHGEETWLMFEGFFPRTVPLAQRGRGAGMQGAAAALHTCRHASLVLNLRAVHRSVLGECYCSHFTWGTYGGRPPDLCLVIDRMGGSART